MPGEDLTRSVLNEKARDALAGLPAVAEAKRLREENLLLRQQLLNLQQQRERRSPTPAPTPEVRESIDSTMPAHGLFPGDNNLGYLEGFNSETAGSGVLSETERANLQTQINELTFGIINPYESYCNLVISQKLIPLTKKYLEYIIERSNILINGNKKATLKDLESKKSFDNLNIHDDEDDDDNTYSVGENSLSKKFEHIKKLYDILTDTNLQKQPSARLKDFYNYLKTTRQEISNHRDPKWKVYLRGCLMVLATILTGIVPGLFIADVASVFNNNRETLFFRSRGQEFVDNVNEFKPKALKSSRS